MILDEGYMLRSSIRATQLAYLIFLASGAKAYAVESVLCTNLHNGETACWLPSAAKAKCRQQVDDLLKSHSVSTAVFTNFSYYPYDPQKSHPRFPVAEVIEHGDFFIAQYEYDFNGKKISVSALQYPKSTSKSKSEVSTFEKLKSTLEESRKKLIEDQNWRMSGIREVLDSMRKINSSSVDPLIVDNNYEETNSTKLKAIEIVFGAATLKKFEECNPILRIDGKEVADEVSLPAENRTGPAVVTGKGSAKIQPVKTNGSERPLENTEKEASGSAR